MITGQQLARAAVDALDKGITYKQERCDEFVKATVKRAGGDLGKSAGSNDMFRNECTGVWPMAMAKELGKIVPGAVCFIVEPGWNEKYNDSLGKADHVGIVTMSPEAEIVHSSESRGGVFPSTFKNAWNYIGWLRDGITYDSKQDNPGRGGDMDTGVMRLHQVVLPAEKAGQTVNLRKEMKGDSIVLAKIPDGTQVMAGDEISGWKPVKYNGLNVFIVSELLADISDTPISQNTFVNPVPYPQKQPLPTTNEARLNALEHAMEVLLGADWRNR